MRIPLASDLESRDGLLTKDALTKNATVEVLNEEEVEFRKRPGQTDLGLIDAGVAQCLAVLGTRVIAVMDGVGYKATLGPLSASVLTGALSGAVSNSTSPFYLQQGSSAALTSPFTAGTTVPVGLLVTPTNGDCYMVTIRSGAPAQELVAIGSPFPTHAGGGDKTLAHGAAYLDGYYFVLTTAAVLHGSALEDPLTWGALDFDNVDGAPGAGVAIARTRQYVIALKEWTTEPYYNARNPTGLILSAVAGGVIDIGCANGASVAELDGRLFWISQSKLVKGRQVHMMLGLEQVKVSTPSVERVLNEDDLATVHAYALKVDGHPTYVLTLGTSGVTLVYNVDAKAWGTWTSYTAASNKSVTSITRSGTTATVTTSTSHGLADGDPVTIAGANQSEYNGTFQITYVSATVFKIEVSGSPATPATGTITATPYTESYFKFTKYTNFGGRDLFLHETDGHLYEMDPGVFRDNGLPINVFGRTARLDGGTTAKKGMPRLTLIGDKAATTVMARWSDDDSTTFVTYRRISMAREEPNTRQCGAYRRRSIEVRHTDNTALRIKALQFGDSE